MPQPDLSRKACLLRIREAVRETLRLPLSDPLPSMDAMLGKDIQLLHQALVQAGLVRLGPRCGCGAMTVAGLTCPTCQEPAE